jgi:hypothetical protein
MHGHQTGYRPSQAEAEAQGENKAAGSDYAHVDNIPVPAGESITLFYLEI